MTVVTLNTYPPNRATQYIFKSMAPPCCVGSGESSRLPIGEGAGWRFSFTIEAAIRPSIWCHGVIHCGFERWSIRLDKAAGLAAVKAGFMEEIRSMSRFAVFVALVLAVFAGLLDFLIQTA